MNIYSEEKMKIRKKNFKIPVWVWRKNAKNGDEKPKGLLRSGERTGDLRCVFDPLM